MSGVGAEQQDALFVLAYYSIGQPKCITQASRGEAGESWVVDTDQGRYLLRCHSPLYTLSSIDFELNLIEYLVSAGFPTAPLVYTRDGARRVEVDGRCWELYAFLSGEGFRKENLAHTRSAAALLARFHKVVAGCHLSSEGIQGRHMGLEHVRQLIDRFESKLSGATRLGRALAKPAVKLLRSQGNQALAGYQLIASRQPTLIHGDFHPDNVLFQGDQAAALLNFSKASYSQRAYDVARGILCFASLKSHHGRGSIALCLDWRRVKAFAEGYQATLPLSGAEIEALPALLRGAYLLDLCSLLEQEHNMGRKLSWLAHAWRFTRWLDKHDRKIAQCFSLH